jgi:short-subunit dehydrogenase involved in D-alanine esterification of teichoic acids
VVNVTSGLALAPKMTGAVYSATKAGLRTFTKALRYQMEAVWRDGGPDVRAVEAMLPLVDTPMTAGRGRRKISGSAAAREILRGLDRERDEIYVGAARALRLLHRLLPGAAERLFRNS